MSVETSRKGGWNGVCNEPSLSSKKEALAARRARVKDTPFFGMMKEMTLVGYYTSEIDATDELLFQPATDKYEGCIPLERNGGRVWAEIG